MYSVAVAAAHTYMVNLGYVLLTVEHIEVIRDVISVEI